MKQKGIIIEEIEETTPGKLCKSILLLRPAKTTPLTVRIFRKMRQKEAKLFTNKNEIRQVLLREAKAF
jgi:hypothetical protein